MKYKLLKEYPFVSVGIVGEYQVGYDKYKFNDDHIVYIDKWIVESSPEWFEPVIERWRALENGEWYYTTADGGLNSKREYIDEIDDGFFEHGNYFKTRDQAEEASKRIKKCLMDYHAEIKE